MCVIIHQPKEAHLEKEEAQRAWTKNPDGGGFAYITDAGSVELKKFMNFSEFWSAFEQARSNNPRRDFLLHMRIATHGTVDLANVHPFWLDEDDDDYQTVMAHNGVIHAVPDYKDGRSDTRVFIDDVLRDLPDYWLDHKHLTRMIEDYIGWSRLAFLTVNPRLEKSVYILNKFKGVEHEGMWFSNDSPIKKQHTWSSPVVRAIPKTTYKTPNWAKKFEPVQTPVVATPVEPDMDARPGKAELVASRIQLGLHHRIIPDISVTSGEASWWCIGCMEEADPDTGDCECFNKICFDCKNIAELCICSEDGSHNLIDWDNAGPDLQNEVLSNFEWDTTRVF